MKSLSYLVLLTLISCGSGNLKKDMDESSIYRTSGSEQFFLAELPSWANASSQGNCLKASSFHYLDFPKIKETYQLNYSQMIELQAQYNDRLEIYFRSTSKHFLKPMEEASFFNSTLEQVRSGVKHLNLPIVSEVEVIWFEGIKPEELKALALSGRFDQKLPILFSSCHSNQSLNQWLTQEKLDGVGFYLITGEWLSPYSSKNELLAGLHLEISALIGPNIKLNIFETENKTNNELILP